MGQAESHSFLRCIRKRIPGSRSDSGSAVISTEGRDLKVLAGIKISRCARNDSISDSEASWKEAASKEAARKDASGRDSVLTNIRTEALIFLEFL